MVKIFADGADKAEMLKLAKNPRIEGLTTNPTLLRKAGVIDYKAFALDILSEIKDKPLSFEVIADDFNEMERQAIEIASWGENVYVKIPITNTKGQSTYHLIETLSISGIKINVTAITTIEQVMHILPALFLCKGAYISVFAGRIADTGVDPLPIMEEAVDQLKRPGYYGVELIWASPREVFNVTQADKIGCDIITCTPDILKKLPLLGKDLQDYSLDTVKMFYNDAIKSGLEL